MKLEIEGLENQTLEPDFWQDQNRAKAVTQKLSQVKSRVEKYEGWHSKLKDLFDLVEIGLDEEDEKLIDEISTEVTTGSQVLNRELERYELENLLSGEYDDTTALVTINAGAGGTDAQDWAEMLLRMYLRWCEQRGFKTEILDQSAGEEAGLKSVIFKVEVPSPMAISAVRRACIDWCASRRSNKETIPGRPALPQWK